jgi:uncharacterized protein YfaS (alpha-2-macroglobulin family)
MISRLCLYGFFFLAALVLPLAPRAQDQSDGTLHVLRPSIDAEQDTAELCLEFDHALDLSDRRRVLAGIRLESDGKTVPIAPANISMTATLLCLQSLIYRQEYSLTVTDLRGTGGEKLNGPYKLPFTIPDRRPALAFSGDPGVGGLVRYTDNDPVLHAINVARVRIALYRISDPARMAEAYRQRLQTTLAPSESLAFAKANGQLVWQGELILDESGGKSANQNLERPIPLRAATDALAPGFYFISAEDTAPPPKTKAAEAGLKPLAAQWFVRSDLKIGALQKDDGFIATAEKADASAVMKGIRILALDRDQQTLGEGESDASGSVFLPMVADKRATAAVLIGLAPSGAIDFVDISPDQGIEDRQDQFILPDLQAALVTDRSFYRPADDIELMLTAHNDHGAAIATPGSLVQLLRPDKSLYATMPVPDDKAGVSWLSFPAPPLHGLWALRWQQADGRVLAIGGLRVTANKKAPHMEVMADRAVLDSSGAVVLTLKSVTDTGAPAPYIAGRILVRWTAPDTLIGWNDYHFGGGEKKDGVPTSIAAFITDANGMAHLTLALKPPDDSAPLHTAVINVQSDPVAGVLDPDPLSLPVKPINYIVGVKPLAPDGKFAENSLARFDVIALDGDGKRRVADDLEYQIYEEGRSFAWFQTEGRWDYKPLQQRRRIGGGTIPVRADGDNVIHWPVTAGAYTLEITDTNGSLLARATFNAGWGLLRSNETKPSDLALTPAAPSVEPGTAAKIAFKLDHPAIITAVVADDRIRKVIHEEHAAGDGTFEFIPEESWGNRIRVKVKAQLAGGQQTPPLAGNIELPVRHNPKELTVTVNAPAHANSGQDLILAVSVGKIVGSQPTFISTLAVPLPTSEDIYPTPMIAKDVTTDTGGNASIHLAIPVFSGDLHLKIIASNQTQWGQKELSILMQASFDADLSLPAIVRTKDDFQLSLGLKNNDMPADTYHYALTTSRGLKITGAAEGKIRFDAAEHKIIPFNLTILESGAEQIKLDLIGSHGFHASRLWPVAAVAVSSLYDDTIKTIIAPRQSWSPADNNSSGTAARTKTSYEKDFVFVSSQPLFDAPRILKMLLEFEPFTTGEIAAWLETSRLWHDVITDGGFLPIDVLQARQKKILERLMARQQADGSFPVLPGNDGDLASTADALLALARADQSLARPAANAASGWLSQRLGNSWFDEKERAVRAAGFAALAATDRLDVSALRYFAETSEGKPLPPLASVQLALALAKSGDQDKAKAWLQAAGDKSMPTLWPMLAENPFFDPQALLPFLQKFSDDFVQHSIRDLQQLTAFMRALAVVNIRSGGWRAAINGEEKDRAGVFVADLSEKPALFTIHNSMDRPLFVVESERREDESPPSSPNVIARHIYKLDGSEIDPGQLKQGEAYLVVLEGAWPSKTEAGENLFLHDMPGSGMHLLGCALDSAVGPPEIWGWLGNLSLTAATSCEAGTHGIDAVITAPAAAKASWRIGYLAEARHAGVFHATPPTTGLGPADEWLTGVDQTIEIR